MEILDEESDDDGEGDEVGDEDKQSKLKLFFMAMELELEEEGAELHETSSCTPKSLKPAAITLILPLE